MRIVPPRRMGESKTGEGHPALHVLFVVPNAVSFFFLMYPQHRHGQ